MGIISRFYFFNILESFKNPVIGEPTKLKSIVRIQKQVMNVVETVYLFPVVDRK